MTLKTSFIDLSIIKYNLKRYWWVSALSFVVLFTATILRILLTDIEYYIELIRDNPAYFGELLQEDPGIMMLIPTVSVLIAVCVLRYLQSPRSATLMHSLPPKRTTLFTSTFISGALLYAAPIVLATIILAALAIAPQFGVLFSLADVFRWCGVFLLYGLAFYSFAMFVGVFTGSSIAQFVFTYIVLALPLGILALCTELLDGWLYAFVSETANPVLETLLKILPFHYPMAASDMYEDVKAWQYILMGGYIIFSYIAGIFFYRKRNIERSGDIVAFNIVKPVFLYGVTVCCALVGAVMIKGITNTEEVSLIALICFGLLGYIAAKMLLLKSFRILKYYKGALVFICAAVLFWLSINFNVIGFGKSTPDPDKVESAYLGTHLNYGWLYNHAQTNYGYPSQNAVFKEQDNINSLIALQQNAIDDVYEQKKRSDSHYSDFYKEYNFFYISYKLKSGRMITREYVLSRNDALALLSTAEAKDCMFTFLRKDSENINFMRVTNEHYSEGQLRNVTVSADEEKAQLIGALIKDTDALSYDELFEYSQNMPLHVEFIIDDPDDSEGASAYMQINEGFKNTLAFLSKYYPEFLSVSTSQGSDTSGYFPHERTTTAPTGEAVTVTSIG